MGSADRIIRVLIAIAFVTLYLTGVISGIWGIVLIVLSIVFVGTSLISFCPLYLPLGLNTLRKNLTSKK